jgi:hypothetical protein
MKEHPIMYPDASRFLLRLQVANFPHSIITYGINTEWQLLKIDATGYRAATKIMSTPDKGAEIERCRHEDGIYSYGQMLGGGDTFHAASAVLIDDKATAFRGLPENCSGFFLQRSEQLLASQRGEVPEKVIAIRSLDELHVRDGVLCAIPGSPAETLEQVRANMLHVLDTRGCFGVYLPYYNYDKVA